MEIDVLNRQEALLIDNDRVRKVVEAVLALEGQRANEMAIYFVDTDEICSLHHEFFDDPSPTDCISFPIDSPEEEHRFLGEVFICPPTALTYCEKEGGDVREEMTLYLIHGLLHLMGYDDIEEGNRAVMRKTEKRHMESLKMKDLIL